MPAIEGAQRPFWMHQVVEYLIGIVLIGAAFQAPEPVVPAVMGAIVVMNAAIARGPASAFPLVGRTVHRWLDVVVMLLLVGAAFQPVFSVDSTGRLLLCGIAFVMFFIWLNSDFAEKATSKKNKKQVKQARQERLARPQSGEIGKKAGRVVGGGVNAAKRMNEKRKEARQEGSARPQSGEIGKKAGRVVGDGVNAAKRMNEKRKEAKND
jgi:hypothetical protein